MCYNQFPQPRFCKPHGVQSDIGETNWAVFKLMFFRRKDLADVEQIPRTQGAGFDHAWVRERLAEMYGSLDPRLSEWDALVQETR